MQALDVYPINMESYVIEVAGKVIDSETKLIRESSTNNIIGCLPKTYRNIIYIMYMNKGMAVSKQRIKSIGWNGKSVSDSSVLVAISEIRTILGEDVIMTVTGEGYVLINA